MLSNMHGTPLKYNFTKGAVSESELIFRIRPDPDPENWANDVSVTVLFWYWLFAAGNEDKERV